MYLLSLLSLLRTPTVTDLVKDSYFSFTGQDSIIRIVHFHNSQCSACDDVEPILEEVSRMYWQEKRVRFAQLDCDKAQDVCDSSNARDLPAWLVWMPGESHSKRYNRNYELDVFTRWIRQQTGIWPHSLPNNSLYLTKEEYAAISKRSKCIFTIVDQPRMPESQPLHNASRNLEKTIRSGATFAAIDKQENPEVAKKLKNKKFGGFFVSRNKWIEYQGEPTIEGIRDFLKENKCPLSIATPTPTPEPLPDLDDLPPDEDMEVEKKPAKEGEPEFVPLDDEQVPLNDDAGDDLDDEDDDGEWNI